MWRGASTKNVGVKGFADAILANHKQKQPNLPPTSLVSDPNSNKNNPTQLRITSAAKRTAIPQ